MNRKILAILSVTIVILIMTPMKTVNAQAPIQNSTTATDYPYDLWHLQDIGVGSDANPKARVHIFNGRNNPYNLMGKYARPFLISGLSTTEQTLPSGTIVYSDVAKNYFTVNKQGYVGVDVINPKTKIHMNNGVFTISQSDVSSTGALSNMRRWQIHGSKYAFAIKDYDAERYRFWISKETGFVGIGTTSPVQKLHVEGNVLVKGNETINGNATVNGNFEVKNGTEINFKVKNNGYVRAREVQVDLGFIPDYVFKEDYELMPLEELKTFVEENNHLPNVKSEAEFKEEGSYSLGEMNLKLLEKVEELTLYVLSLQAQIDELKIK